MSLAGKLAFVTGAARGQGASHCRYLAKAGVNIFAIDVCQDLDEVYQLGTEAELHETVSQCQRLGVKAYARRADVRREDEVADAVDDAIKQFGAIDILLNNAGVVNFHPLQDLSVQAYEVVMDVNLRGAFITTKHVVRSMIEREFGRIVNTASASGVKPLPYGSHYAASKGGLILATKSWAAEFAQYGINVNCVAPGTVYTGMVKGLAKALDRDPLEAFAEFSQPHLFKGERGQIAVEDISEAVMFLVGDGARQITGQVLAVDAGFTSS